MKSLWLAICVVAVAFLRMTEADSDEPAKPEKPARDPILGKELGQVRDDNGLKMKLVWCLSGIVPMDQVEHIAEPVAETDDAPAPNSWQSRKITPVKVALTKGFWLGKYEVTQSEWKQVMNTEPWKGQDLTKEGPDYPATFVSWNDAVDFCRKVTERERQAGRLSNDWEYTLPTEAQWERACRARTETRFSFGDDRSKLGDYAWCGDNARNAGEEYAHRVGQKKPNPWGHYDMHGNVWEWCRDVYAEKLPRGLDPVVIPTEKTESSDRVLKGGSWRYIFADWRSGLRYGNKPDIQNALNGFRLALSAAPAIQPEDKKVETPSGDK